MGGIWRRDIVRMCGAQGFRLEMHKRFVYGMHNLFVFEVVGTPSHLSSAPARST